MDKAIVRDWMTLNPYTTTPYTMLIDAYQVMMNYDIRRLPVLDEDHHLIGMVTLSDIRSIATSSVMQTDSTLHLLSETPVSKVMSKHPVTIHPEAPLSKAAELMYENKFGGLPVMAGNMLVGIISESDLFRFVMSFSPQYADITAEE